MSDARAIEGVTATLLQIVDDAVNKGPQAFPGGVKVIAQPPHEVQTDIYALQVNLFLYRTEIAAGLRNEDPIDTAPGESAQPPLPLVLHYLITPYVQSGRDTDAHRLLGLAARAVHEQSLLSQAQLSDSSGTFSNVATQLDRIRITWQPLAESDIYSLWSAFQTPYRLSAAFEVRAVLIDGRQPPRTPVPVLRRGAHDEGPVALAATASTLPELDTVVSQGGQESVRLGESVQLRGRNLFGQTVTARLTHPLVPAPVLVPATNVTDAAITITMPAAPADIPAGLWAVALDITNTIDAQQVTLSTNVLGLAVAPRITSAMPVSVQRDAQSAALISLTCEPEVVAGQPVLLIVDGRAIPEQRSVTGGVVDGAALSFSVTAAPLGEHVLRLRVAGVDSQFIDRSQPTPQFDVSQKVTVAP